MQLLPSGNGAKHHFAAKHQTVAFGGKADSPKWSKMAQRADLDLL
jgi:hypothetical protein